MNTPETLLEFPHTSYLKAMGRNEDDFKQLIYDLVQRYVPGLADEALSTRLSSGGRYLSVTVTFLAESQDQLDAIYRELGASPRVLMAL